MFFNTPNATGVRVFPKVCEGCARYFYRKVLDHIGIREHDMIEKYCPKCNRRLSDGTFNQVVRGSSHGNPLSLLLRHGSNYTNPQVR